MFSCLLKMWEKIPYINSDALSMTTVLETMATGDQFAKILSVRTLTLMPAVVFQTAATANVEMGEHGIRCALSCLKRSTHVQRQR